MSPKTNPKVSEAVRLVLACHDTRVSLKKVGLYYCKMMARNVNKKIVARKQSEAVTASSVAALATFEKGESEAKAVLAKQVAETKADEALSGDDPLKLLRWKMPWCPESHPQGRPPNKVERAEKLSRPALHSARA